MSKRARLLNAWLRRVEKPAMLRAKDADQLRRRFDTHAKFLFRAPRGTQTRWQVLAHDDNRIDVLGVLPPDLQNDVVILYLHGGGFVFGSPEAYGAMVAQMCHRLNARAVIPRYRLAPEAPFPAAFQDVRSAWEGLLRSGVDPANIIIGGDSAGGTLSLSLLAQLLRDKAALPAGVFCFSPLTDMTYGADSFVSNAQAEAVLPATRAHDMAQMYLNGHPAQDPQVSPHYADFEGAPPVWITAGDTEILRDDARRMNHSMRGAGVDMTYVEKHDLPHVWPLFHNTLPEARETLDDLAGWIRRVRGLPNES